MLDAIHVHGGLPKTGSTYIQNGLQLLSSRGLLKRVGYPLLDTNDEFNRIGSGNGIDIANAVLHSGDKRAVLARVESCVDELLAKAGNHTDELLISSEYFFFADPVSFAVLRDVLSARASRLHMVFSVRPLREWTYSVYGQYVKAHGLAEPYGVHWLEKQCSQFLSCFANLDRSGIETSVFAYSKRHQFAKFLEVIGEDESLAGEVPAMSVNASLGVGDLELVRRLNAVFGDSSMTRGVAEELSRNASDNDGYMPPELDAAYQQFAEGFRARLEEMKGPVMERVREVLFSAPDADPQASPAERHGELRGDALDIVLRNLAPVVAEYSREAEHFRALKKASAALSKSNLFFDPMHYLLMYPDILDGGMDPWEHYLEHGRKEGRMSALIRKGLEPASPPAEPDAGEKGRRA